MKSRAKSEDIRRYILENAGSHPRDVAKLASQRFKITRQAVNKHLQRLVSDKLLSETGKTRNRAYKLLPLVEREHVYKISPSLEEHVVWAEDVSPTLGPQAENITDIWQYGFTEMFNNAREHSGGTEIVVKILKTAVDANISVTDNGVGIFKKIQQALKLPDEYYAIFELSKGKLTTDPQHHTGEGIFFASRMFDAFKIMSGHVVFRHEFKAPEDWITNEPHLRRVGTSVGMTLSHHNARTARKIFDQYASDEDYGFNKTVVPVSLAQFGNDKLISRSQAKRVLSRVDLFKVVILDFAGVPTIGQAFADEMFRVFAKDHPQLELIPVHANSEVKRMIQRAKSTTAALSSPAKSTMKTKYSK